MSSATAKSPSMGSREATFASFFDDLRREPIYVVLGVQGSGTNLLRSLLVRAFNFAFIQDRSIVYNAALQLGDPASEADVRRQFEVVRSRLFPSVLGRKLRRRIKSNAPYDGIEQHFDPSAIRSPADFARFVYAYGAYRQGTRLMAIKSDDIWETIDRIDTALPNRRIILLTRDFRDNLLSITKKDFGPVDPLIAARYVKQRFAHYDAEYQQTPPEHRLHVKYEELLETPDDFVARFAGHFGLNAGQVPPPVDTARIRRNNTRKWGQLSRRQLAGCEAVLRNELQSYGYELASPPGREPGTAAWIAAAGRDTLARIPQKLRALAAKAQK